jgi:hypothetical protein
LHNFGLTCALVNQQVSVGGAPATTINAPKGLPNPGGSPDLNFGFQVRPLAKPAAQCPPGGDCCNFLTVQSGHAGLGVAMADGSVRSLSAGMAPETWRRLLLPRDGEVLAANW